METYVCQGDGYETEILTVPLQLTFSPMASLHPPIVPPV